MLISWPLHRVVQKTSARLGELAPRTVASSHNLADVFMDNPGHLDLVALKFCVHSPLLGILGNIACVRWAFPFIPEFPGHEELDGSGRRHRFEAADWPPLVHQRHELRCRRLLWRRKPQRRRCWCRHYSGRQVPGPGSYFPPTATVPVPTATTNYHVLQLSKVMFLTEGLLHSWTS